MYRMNEFLVISVVIAKRRTLVFSLLFAFFTQVVGAREMMSVLMNSNATEE